MRDYITIRRRRFTGTDEGGWIEYKVDAKLVEPPGTLPNLEVFDVKEGSVRRGFQILQTSRFKGIDANGDWNIVYLGEGYKITNVLPVEKKFYTITGEHY